MERKATDKCQYLQNMYVKKKKRVRLSFHLGSTDSYRHTNEIINKYYMMQVLLCPGGSSAVTLTYHTAAGSAALSLLRLL